MDPGPIQYRRQYLLSESVLCDASTWKPGSRPYCTATLVAVDDDA